MMRAGRIHIGTSGWHYRHWVGPYYPTRLPARSWLDHYVHDFAAAEINGSFYRMPSETTLTAWRDGVPANFRFAVKASRYLSHARKLTLPITDYDRFFEGIAALQPKLGPILLQTPPHWRLDRDRLEAFLKAAPKRYRYAFEFREPSWLVPDVYKLLAKHRAALCLYHLAGFESPIEVTADFVYIRLHGPGAKYQGSYSTAALKAWARRLRAWQRQGLSVWCFFDNDQNGYAAQDALRLQRLIPTTEAGGKGAPGKPARRQSPTAPARRIRPRSTR